MTPKYSKEEIKKLIQENEDFINSKKYRYSLNRYEQQREKQRQESAPDSIIAHLLCMTPEEVQQVYKGAVHKIRQFMKIKVESENEDT